MLQPEIHGVFRQADFSFGTLFSSEVPPASFEYSWEVLIPNYQLYSGSLIRLFNCGTFLGFIIIHNLFNSSAGFKLFSEDKNWNWKNFLSAEKGYKSTGWKGIEILNFSFSNRYVKIINLLSRNFDNEEDKNEEAMFSIFLLMSH